MTDQPPSILVIDDDRSLLLGLQAILKRAGYQTLVASSGNEGLALAEERHPDLIVCDVMMPPPNGLEVRRTLARNPRTATIPFIFLTARVSQADKVHGIELGADDYIVKPFDRDELLARIKAVLRRDATGRMIGRQEAAGEVQQMRRVTGSVVARALDSPLRNLVLTGEGGHARGFGGVDDSPWLGRSPQDAVDVANLVDDLMILDALEHSSYQAVRAQVDLQAEYFDTIEECLRRWRSRNLSSVVEIEGGVIVTAPPGLFGRLAVNQLVDNACKFSPHNGRISVRLAHHGYGGCVLDVIDQGPGVPSELRERVFERYFQLGPVGELTDLKGLGIGLTVARAFARALAGDAFIRDVADGCAVRLTLGEDSAGPPVEVLGDGVLADGAS